VMYKFVKFPKMWQVCLEEKRADGSAYRVALYLLDNVVPLGNRVLEKHGVSRASKWRALEHPAQCRAHCRRRAQG
jgi:hypothetical protein